jgi:ribosome-associated protein
MDIRRLQRVIVDALEDVKGQDIQVFNTAALSDMFDRVVIASGTSNRQTRALASSVAEKVKAAGGAVVSMEGEESGEWVLVDCGDAVVHILQPAIRDYYNLEEIWGGKKVQLKSASEPSIAEKKAVAKKAPARKAAVAKARKAPRAR